jgi:hypothetical protein
LAGGVVERRTMNLLDLLKSSSFFSLGCQPKEEGLCLNKYCTRGMLA